MSEELPPQQPSTTTVEHSLKTAGQRRVNMIWEFTQAAIAIVIIAVFAFNAVMARNIDPFYAGIVGMVIGFYFGRTNHARIGDEPRATGLDDR